MPLTNTPSAASQPSELELRTMRRSYLFAGLEDGDYAAISVHTQMLEVSSGQMIFAQNTPVSAIYWVVDGMVKLTRTSVQGDEKVIELIGPGRFFAEAVLFMGNGYPVNAVAQGACRLISVDGAHLKEWLAQDAQRCFRMMSGISMRLHKLVADIDRLTLMKGTDRLLQYLIDHSEPDDTGRTVVEFEAPKQVVASRIGIKPETLSRLLHKLSEQGCIEVQGARVFIADVEHLRQIKLD
jgi:CRP/FNR family transcriptional regulator, dissimilatory nitrate respiration regulator